MTIQSHTGYVSCHSDPKSVDEVQDLTSLYPKLRVSIKSRMPDEMLLWDMDEVIDISWLANPGVIRVRLVGGPDYRSRTVYSDHEVVSRLWFLASSREAAMPRRRLQLPHHQRRVPWNLGPCASACP